MEVIKKTILQALTTGTTIVEGVVKYIIIPDPNAVYHMKIGLESNSDDIGFFDTYTVTGEYDYINLSGATPEIRNENLKIFSSILTGSTTVENSGLLISHNSGEFNEIITSDDIIVTGSTESRLIELKKYRITNVFEQMYVSGGTLNNGGVVYSASTSNDIVYYIGGIRYHDIITGSTSGTTYSFISKGYDSSDFINLPYYKNVNKENIISNPKIDDDVFIIRQESSAFENNYRLEYVKNLNDLITYAGGNYFKIVNNS